MSAESIQQLLEKQPFEPFEVRMSHGEVHQVKHPEFAFVLKSNLIIGYPGTDRFAICSLMHITQLTHQAA